MTFLLTILLIATIILIFGGLGALCMFGAAQVWIDDWGNAPIERGAQVAVTLIVAGFGCGFFSLVPYIIRENGLL